MKTAARKVPLPSIPKEEWLPLCTIRNKNVVQSVAAFLRTEYPMFDFNVVTYEVGHCIFPEPRIERGSLRTEMQSFAKGCFVALSIPIV